MADPLRLLAAGSLARAFETLGPMVGHEIETVFGPSGLLRGRIEAGAAWDVFASADTDHPARLHAAGLGTAPRIFCCNDLQLIPRPGLDGDDAEALLRRPDLRIGISTPGKDPSGDYAVRALDRLEPGLAARALRLTGDPALTPPPAGRNPYAWVLTSNAADMMLTYRSNAVAARQDTPALRALDLPETMRIVATYALTIRVGAGAMADRLADLLLSDQLQDRLLALGFTPPPNPAATDTIVEECTS